MDTLKKIAFFICLVATIAFASLIESCSKSDDKSIHDELNELEMRVENLDDLSERANSQITALQGLIHALEQNDHIIDIATIIKGSKEVAYTIFFNDRAPIHIYNGEDGKDGPVPIIGIEKGDDRKRYWTVQVGTTPVEFILDAKGQKVSVTGSDGTNGADGSTDTRPMIDVAAYEGANTNFTGKLCWKVNDKFLFIGDNPVIATGAQTGAIFKENGIIIDQANSTITFTLADGTSTITLPFICKLTV